MFLMYVLLYLHVAQCTNSVLFSPVYVIGYKGSELDDLWHAVENVPYRLAAISASALSPLARSFSLL